MTNSITLERRAYLVCLAYRLLGYSVSKEMEEMIVDSFRAVRHDTFERAIQLCELEADDVKSMNDISMTGSSEIAKQCAKRIRNEMN